MAGPVDRDTAAGARRTQAGRRDRHTYRRGHGRPGARFTSERRVPVTLWRIAAESRNCPAADLSSACAAKYSGRWNDDGQPVIYAAPTIAMAVLETAAHVHDTGLPLNRFLLELEVPDAIWALHEVLDVATLAATWSAIPAGHESGLALAGFA
jgi:RES domain-containing protein